MKKLAVIGIMILTLALPSCSVFDSKTRDAARAFGVAMELYPAEEYEESRWRITAPDGDAMLAFDNMGVDMAVDAAPFAAAGADLSKLDTAQTIFYPDGESLNFSSPGSDMLNRNIKSTPLAQFEYNLQCLRDYLSYSEDTGRYSLNVDGLDNKIAFFEWAKDPGKDDKRMSFVIDAQPFINAGVDPESVEGWEFAQDRFIKTF